MNSRLTFDGAVPPSWAKLTLDHRANDRPYLQVEDGGQAVILEFYDPDDPDENNGVFVRVQSWDERAVSVDPAIRAESHAFFRAHAGKKIRVTVEVID